MREPDDLDWLVGALHCSGLGAEAFALQHESVRRQARPAAWESLIRSVLTRDPWWARELLEEAAGNSRELDALRIDVAVALGDAAPSIVAWQEAHRDERAR